MEQFYGDKKEYGDIIPTVEDASYEAFQVMVDLFYNKKISFESLDFNVLAELYKLANKHILQGLQESIIVEVFSRKITPDDLLDGAKVAEKFALLENFSESLYIVCSEFVKENVDKVLEVFANEEPGVENSVILHKLMARASKIRTTVVSKSSAKRKHQSELDEMVADLRKIGTNVTIQK